MQILVNKIELTNALKSVSRIAEKRSRIDILQYVRIDAGKGGASFTATDLDVSETVCFPCDTGMQDAVCAPLSVFAKMAKQLPNGLVLIETATVNDVPRLSVSCENTKFDLETRLASDFPLMGFPQDGEFSIPADALRRMIEKTRHAISQEETRYYLNGIFFEADTKTGVLNAVATDGHRMAVASCPLPVGAEIVSARPSDTVSGIIVPRKTCLEMLKLLAKQTGNVTVCLSKDGRLATFGIGATKIVSKLIDGTFPDYRRVIPCATEGDTLTVDHDALLTGVTRAAAMAADKMAAVKFVANGKLILSAVNPSAGVTKEEIAADWSNKAEPIEVGFNGKYVADILGKIDGETVVFRMRDAKGPARITDPEDPSTLHVLMPMRV